MKPYLHQFSLAAFVSAGVLSACGLQCAYAATRIWDGGGVNAFWTNAVNWSNNIAPVAGDDLVFPSGAAGLTNTNNFASGTVFQSILLSGTGYSLRGSNVTLNAGISNSSGVNSILFPLTLASNQTVSCSSGATFNLSAAIDTNAKDLTFDGAGGFFVFGNIGGSGGLIKNGISGLVLSVSNAFTGVTTINAGNVTILHDASLGGTGSGTTVNAGGSLQVQNDIRLAEGLTLFGTLRSQIGTNLWTGAVTLSSAGAAVIVATNSLLIISNAIAGSGGLVKDGTGVLQFAGSTANTYAGSTTVNAGKLHLFKTAGITAVPGPLVIGDSSGGNGADIVELGRADQIADAATVSLSISGRIDLAGNSETIGPLTMDGGLAQSGAGVLTLNGDVTRVASPVLEVSTITGNLSLGGVSRTFTINTNPGISMTVAANIRDGGASAGLIKNGDGFLSLLVSNSYSGATTVNAGALRIDHGFGLGTAAGGTTVSTGAVLQVNGGISVPETAITLSGSLRMSDSFTNTLTGTITLAVSNVSVQGFTAAGRFNFSGAIIGSGGMTIGSAGSVELSGGSPNTYTGTTTVNAGTLLLNKTPLTNAIAGSLVIGDGTGGANADVVRWLAGNQIANTSAVTVASSGLLDLNNNGETLGSLAGSGNVTLGSGVLTVGGDNSSTLFSGLINGSGVLAKNGGGTFTMSGNNTYASTTMNGGTLLINGSQPGNSVSFNIGTLGGTGAVGTVTTGVNVSPKTLSPGSSPGLFTSGAITFSSNVTFRVELNGAAPGVSYDQLLALGTVNLAGCTLSNSLGFTPILNDTFTIINNSSPGAVIGTFAGLTNNASFALGGLLFRINYDGGTGNDVVLTRIAAPPSQLTAIVVPPGGAARIDGLGVPGVAYSIEATTSLNAPVTWVTLGADAADGAGLFQFLDHDATNYPSRFYRAVSP